jgi:hypothetical protein
LWLVFSGWALGCGHYGATIGDVKLERNITTIMSEGNDRPKIKSFIYLDEYKSLVHRLDSIDMINQANTLLSTIEDVVSELQVYLIDLGRLPELSGSILDDGALALEWIFYDYRLGFSIEPDTQESLWYLVANEKFGEISASGSLANIDLNPLINWLLRFILLHSASAGVDLENN